MPSTNDKMDVGGAPRPMKDRQEIDPGTYNLKQGGYEVGRVIVFQGTPTTTKIEHWFLFTANSGTTIRTYTYPGSTATSVTMTFEYSGPPPNTFNGSDYRGALPVAADYIIASCVRQ